MTGRNIQLEDILSDPHRFGFCTFDEFKKNPDKWRKRPEAVLESADIGTRMFQGQVSGYTYEFEGHDAKTLEQIERMARDEGVELTNLEMSPHVIPQGNGKCKVHIAFRRKSA